MGEYVLRAAASAGAEAGLHDHWSPGREAMRRAFAREGLEFIEQKEQLGTGHGA